MGADVILAVGGVLFIFTAWAGVAYSLQQFEAWYDRENDEPASAEPPRDAMADTGQGGNAGEPAPR